MPARELALVAFAAIVVLLIDPELVSGQPGASSPASVATATILAAPEEYEGRQVVIQERVVRARRALFPNGRSYYTLLVGDERVSLTVFSWERPSVKERDLVEVVGVFHVWRYNIRHMIESARITRLGP